MNPLIPDFCYWELENRLRLSLEYTVILHTLGPDLIYFSETIPTLTLLRCAAFGLRYLPPQLFCAQRLRAVTCIVPACFLGYLSSGGNEVRFCRSQPPPSVLRKTRSWYEEQEDER